MRRLALILTALVALSLPSAAGAAGKHTHSHRRPAHQHQHRHHRHHPGHKADIEELITECISIEGAEPETVCEEITTAQLDEREAEAHQEGADGEAELTSVEESEE